MESVPPSTTPHKGTCYPTTQRLVGEWLGLMTTIDLPKSCVLQDEEIELICYALSHTFKVDGNIFTVKEACKVSNEGGLLKESECGCPLHLKISVNCTYIFSVFLCSFMILTE